MTPFISILVSFVVDDSILRFAFKFDMNVLPDGYDSIKYWRERENEVAIYNLLPEHWKEFGRMVALEEICDVDSKV